MRIGIGSYTYAWAIGVKGHESPSRPMTAAELVRRASELGLGVVQICDNLPLEAMPPTQRRELATAARDVGVAVQVGTRGCGIEHLRRCIDVCTEFGSRLLRVVVDSAGDEPSPAEIVARIAAVAQELRAAGVVLAIENHDRFRASTFAWIVRNTPPGCAGICLDTVNSFGALEGPDAVLTELLPLTVNLHVKDFTIRRRPHQMGFEIEGAPAGEGRLNIPDLFARVGDIDAILELWTPPAATLAQTMERERDWAERSVAYLKNIAERLK